MIKKWMIPLLAFFCLSFSCELVAGERVQLTASDGHPLVGTLTRPDNKDMQAGVVLLPMYRHTRESWQPLVDQLRISGFTCLALDLRGHGESRLAADGSNDEIRVLERDPKLFNRMHLDAAAAADWLTANTEIKPDRISLIGASVGCSVAIHAVISGVVNPAAVVVMTPGANYLGVPTMEHIKKWPGTPLLILSSEEEKGRGAQTIYNTLQNKGAELKLFSETDIHGTNMFGVVDDVEKLISNWLTKLLSPKSASAVNSFQGLSLSGD